jgi:hypothetical protein
LLVKMSRIFPLFSESPPGHLANQSSDLFATSDATAEHPRPTSAPGRVRVAPGQRRRAYPSEGDFGAGGTKRPRYGPCRLSAGSSRSSSTGVGYSKARGASSAKTSRSSPVNAASRIFAGALARIFKSAGFRKSRVSEAAGILKSNVERSAAV